MSIDRFGQPLYLGYSAVEEEYLRAANRLIPYERLLAFTDISEMTGRSVPNLREKANKMRQEKIDQEWADRASKLVPERSLARKLADVPMTPSIILKPSRGRLMGTR